MENTNEAFEAFWTEYPRKVAKKIAMQKWMKLHPNQELQKKILKSLAEHKRTDQWQKDNGRFIPHPATWIHQERWDSEVVISKTTHVYVL